MECRVPVAARCLAVAGILAVASLASVTAAPNKAGPWVFSYFLDNGQDGLHLAYSRDGLAWTPLHEGQPFLAPAVGGKLMRDPCIMLGPDNVFHAVWTTGWWEQGIGIGHSKDLLTWTGVAFLPVMVHERKAANAWAPEIIFDEHTQQYVIFWATAIPGRFPATDDTADIRSADGWRLNHRIYRTTTKDFKEYSRAELFLDPGVDVIDATIVRDGARYVMFLKDETKFPEPRKEIRAAFADHALGPYALAPGPVSVENWVEGPTAFRAGADMIVLFDAYTRHRFEGVRSHDLKTWTPLGGELQMPPGARHGTVFAVAEKILQGLLAN
jgi:hypothetical protein